MLVHYYGKSRWTHLQIFCEYAVGPSCSVRRTSRTCPVSDTNTGNATKIILRSSRSGTYPTQFRYVMPDKSQPDQLKLVLHFKLSSMNNTDFISLTSLYVLAAQLYYVICNNNGSVEFNRLEYLYEQYYSKPLKLSSFNINSVNEFYNRFNLMFYIRGSKKKSVVVLNKNLQGWI